jgi:hypothetical protein
MARCTTGINGTGQKFGHWYRWFFFILLANLPPVSLTGGKFGAGVSDIGGKLSSVSTTPA